MIKNFDAVCTTAWRRWLLAGALAASGAGTAGAEQDVSSGEGTDGFPAVCRSLPAADATFIEVDVRMHDHQLTASAYRTDAEATLAVGYYQGPVAYHAGATAQAAVYAGDGFALALRWQGAVGASPLTGQVWIEHPPLPASAPLPLDLTCDGTTADPTAAPPPVDPGTLTLPQG